jgi:hypothetical protein
MKRIWYHGTTAGNARQIWKTGFKEGTYFANGLQDALAMGGDHVFEVLCDFGDAEPWQVICANVIPPDQICALRRYQVTALYEDRSLINPPAPGQEQAA